MNTHAYISQTRVTLESGGETAADDYAKSPCQALLYQQFDEYLASPTAAW